MPERGGNWFTGYYGQANYKPSSYAFQSDRFLRNEDAYQKDQMDATAQDAMLQQLWQQGFNPQAPTGPSQAELQMRKGFQDRTNAAMSLLGSAGLNPALASRRALSAQNASLGDMSTDAAILRAQEDAQRRAEQYQTQALYGQLLGGARAQNQTMGEADRQALIELERLKGAQNLGLNQLNVQQEIANAGALGQGGLMGPLLGGLSTLGAGYLMGRG